jgi:hypothetical protein
MCVARSTPKKENKERERGKEGKKKTQIFLLLL